MPVRSERCRAGGAAGSASSAPSGAAASSLVPPPPINTAQPGVATSLLYSGAKFRGQQRSKGNAYEVEVVMQVRGRPRAGLRFPSLGLGPSPDGRRAGRAVLPALLWNAFPRVLPAPSAPPGSGAPFLDLRGPSVSCFSRGSFPRFLRSL